MILTPKLYEVTLMLIRILPVLVLGLSLLFIGCDDITNPGNTDQNNVTGSENETVATITSDRGGPENNPVSSSNSILEIAATDENFSILAQAVLFAGLDDVLDGNRQLTVFAPTNDAFAALLGDLGLTAEQLLVEDNKGLVTDILLYHVAPGKRQAKSVINAEQIRMLLGKFTEIETEDSKVYIGNEENGFATIVQTDIFASNGVIHVIDSVLLPPTSDDHDDEEDDDDEDDDEDEEDD